MFTPPVSRRLRPYAKDYETTLKAKVKESISANGTSKWIMKSSMIVLCEAPLTAEEVHDSKKDEISRIRSYTKADEIKLNDALRLSDTKTIQINDLLLRYQQIMKKTQMLKKLIVL